MQRFSELLLGGGSSDNPFARERQAKMLLSGVIGIRATLDEILLFQYPQGLRGGPLGDSQIFGHS